MAAVMRSFFGVPVDKQPGVLQTSSERLSCKCYRSPVASTEEEKDTSNEKKSLFSNITEALDFSQVRSEKDAELLDDARQATRMGEKMSREQYAALRRKIGGTYKDFFKESVDVKGKYVEAGWVDKRCKVCGKDTSTEPRSKDRFGRYAHNECLQKKNSGNFFSRLFGN